MFARTFKLALAVCALAAACAAPAAAQQKPAENGEVFADTNAFKNRVFEIKYRDPNSLLQVVRLLGSGLRGASMDANRNFKTITVRDLPENIAAVEDALKRLDTPEAARPEVELHMHVLIAGVEGGAPVPAELRDVLGQLQTTLNFKSYYLLTSIIQRAKEQPFSPGFLQGEGVATLALPNVPGGRDFRYVYNANSLTLSANPGGATVVQLGSLDFQLAGGSELGSAHIRSDVGVREGEKVVVGTAGLKDKALILVVTAKLLK
ncbi:MAG TPA: secretin N-terminal domain-containing protein [Pyrinomonadaceae bacterium]|jgi:hypothetical protein